MKLKYAIPYILLMALAIGILLAYQTWKTVVTDNEPPVFHVADQVLEISVSDDTKTMLQGITASDNRDGDVTASILIEKIGKINDNHEITVTYAAFDKAGNVAKHGRTVRYRDYKSPRFALSEPLMYLVGREVSVERSIHAYDLIDGDISRKVKPTLVSELALTVEGTHQMMFRVTNSLGDTVELQLPVEIYPTSKYTAQLNLTEYLVYIPKGSSFDANDYLKDFTYQDMIVSEIFGSGFFMVRRKAAGP